MLPATHSLCLGQAPKGTLFKTRLLEQNYRSEPTATSNYMTTKALHIALSMTANFS